VKKQTPPDPPESSQASQTTQAPRTGRLRRSAIAGVAVARAGMAHLSHKAQGLARSDAQQEKALTAHEARLGRILFGALNQLKGTALKASQLLSMELGFLPDGMRAELARAHYQATPLNRALVIKLLRQEFKQSPQELFAQFEPHAFAAASLGQVHAATLHSGEAVAVKLQYPGMAASVRSDMALIRSLLQAVMASAKGSGASSGARSGGLPSRAIIANVMADIEEKLSEELDYLHEASQLVWFGQQLMGPEKLQGVVVPLPVMAFTSPRVLTMQRLHGLHLDEWLRTQPSQARRDHFGQLLFDTFMHCTFALHRLQADPHPGNYLFMDGARADEPGQLGLLDFGCTRQMNPDFCAGVASAWSALLCTPSDATRLHQAYLQLGMVSPGLSQHKFQTRLMPALADLQRWQTQPFATDMFDFGQHPPPPRMSPQQRHQTLPLMHAIPPDLPYFDRAYLGLMQLLRALGARVRTTNPWIHKEHHP
jgi:predicted unusual protein kinase regulating ubiquinone biosynthesis (AarF/ABC1/UbiB family)